MGVPPREEPAEHPSPACAVSPPAPLRLPSQKGSLQLLTRTVSGARVCWEFRRLLHFPDLSQLPTSPGRALLSSAALCSMLKCLKINIVFLPEFHHSR